MPIFKENLEDDFLEQSHPWQTTRKIIALIELAKKKGSLYRSQRTAAAAAAWPCRIDLSKGGGGRQTLSPKSAS